MFGFAAGQAPAAPPPPPPGLHSNSPLELGWHLPAPPSGSLHGSLAALHLSVPPPAAPPPPPPAPHSAAPTTQRPSGHLFGFAAGQAPAAPPLPPSAAHSALLDLQIPFGHLTWLPGQSQSAAATTQRPSGHLFGFAVGQPLPPLAAGGVLHRNPPDAEGSLKHLPLVPPGSSQSVLATVHALGVGVGVPVGVGLVQSAAATTQRSSAHLFGFAVGQPLPPLAVGTVLHRNPPDAEGSLKHLPLVPPGRSQTVLAAVHALGVGVGVPVGVGLVQSAAPTTQRPSGHLFGFAAGQAPAAPPPPPPGLHSNSPLELGWHLPAPPSGSLHGSLAALHLSVPPPAAPPPPPPAPHSAAPTTQRPSGHLFGFAAGQAPAAPPLPPSAAHSALLDLQIPFGHLTWLPGQSLSVLHRNPPDAEGSLRHLPFLPPGSSQSVLTAWQTDLSVEPPAQSAAATTQRPSGHLFGFAVGQPLPPPAVGTVLHRNPPGPEGSLKHLPLVPPGSSQTVLATVHALGVGVGVAVGVGWAQSARPTTQRPSGHLLGLSVGQVASVPQSAAATTQRPSGHLLGLADGQFAAVPPPAELSASHLNPPVTAGSTRHVPLRPVLPSIQAGPSFLHWVLLLVAPAPLSTMHRRRPETFRHLPITPGESSHGSEAATQSVPVVVVPPLFVR